MESNSTGLSRAESRGAPPAEARGWPTALTIAGSDSGAGAGIQADLKTFAAHGVYGTSAITALTAQNTVGVTAVHVVPDDFLAAQIEAIVTDLGCDAVKTGMLATATIVESVAAAVESFDLPNLVVDPVMVAKSGDHLLDDEAVHAVRWTLLRLARVVTPNIPEAEVLAKMAIKTADDMREAARRIAMLKPAAVVIKGGHLAGPEVIDILLEDGEFHEWIGPRIEGPNTHGTGCTFASAIAAHLAKGASLIEAVPAAKAYVEGAIRHGIPLGKGHRPLNHFWRGIY
ncbi:MAG TPA: bifunctional hydroxymethylpyrimidine kinase/phosphomethylpyrimidine kinase [Vicinamibacterales bacterium]|nr:bifunctional hydroxymethylpyrimidine kinase/phosphomethylpyrimidine kinase [Vicinamibacterales bacterium]